VPADGCGTIHDGKYAYWAYFHGTNGSWSYANIGPGGSRVSSDVAEGWRWEPAGTGSPNDPPPRTAASTAACAPVPPPPQPPPAAGPQVTTGGATTSVTTVPAGGSAATPTPGATRGGATTPMTAAAATRTPRPKTTSTGDASSMTISPRTERALAARATARRSHGGAPVGLVVGILLVAMLGVGGGIAARRRNRPAT
jgi:hypothetical protein